VAVQLAGDVIVFGHAIGGSYADAVVLTGVTIANISAASFTG
jgi:hypothetical protein